MDSRATAAAAPVPLCHPRHRHPLLYFATPPPLCGELVE